MRARAEFTVEPFVDGNPGPHVQAAIDVVSGAGLTPVIGPFATTFEANAEEAAEVIAAMLKAASAAGADRVSLNVEFSE